MTDLQLNAHDILSVADDLFHAQGFAETRLTHIADEAGIPLEMVERQYEDTAHIALCLYHQLANESLDWVDTLPTGTISERYHALLSHKLSQWQANEEITVALFSTAMLPQSSITPIAISQGKDDPMLSAMHSVVDGASDHVVRHAEDITLMMYAFHFLVVIFWLYDRTDKKQASHIFVGFLREFIKLIRPMMVMPLVSKAMSHMAKIIMLVFGGAKLSSDK
ncbi:MAG: TetR/AcrR family transcriptional regulator [Chloroflexota bacterium]